MNYDKAEIHSTCDKLIKTHKNNKTKYHQVYHHGKKGSKMKNGFKCYGWLSPDNQFVIPFIYTLSISLLLISEVSQKKCELEASKFVFVNNFFQSFRHTMTIFKWKFQLITNIFRSSFLGYNGNNSVWLYTNIVNIYHWY